MSLSEADRSAILDQAVFSKILPRLRGQETPALQGALSKLKARLGALGLSDCVAKLDEMLVRLEATGVTRFWA